MQPAGQSPQPISIVTAKPAAAGVAVWKQHWPIRFGSWAFRPANRGSVARTSAAAASGVVIEVGPGASEGCGDPTGDDADGGTDGSGAADAGGGADWPQAPGTRPRASRRVGRGNGEGRRG